MDVPRILVLDSGIGGLSVASEIRKQVPSAKLFYLADLEFFPYGVKTESALIDRVTWLINQVSRQFFFNIVVVACNTASTVVLNALRARFNLPFVGVVPAIKPAALLSKNRTVGVLATEGTVTRQYTANLIRDFASHCDVFLYGSQLLVDIAENKLRGEHIDQTAIRHEIDCLIRLSATNCIDTVVLACTHFPLLLPELKAAAPGIKHWVDSGEAIARRVQHWIDHLGLDCSQPNNLNCFMITASPFSYDNDAVRHLLGNYENRSPAV